MAQSHTPYHFPEAVKITDTAEFNRVSRFATEITERMKGFAFSQMIGIFAKNNGVVDLKNRNFIDAMTSLFYTDPHDPKEAGRPVICFNNVIDDVVKKAKESKLSTEHTDKLLMDVKNNINNFKNIVYSNKAELELLIAKYKLKSMIRNSVAVRDSTSADSKFVEVEGDIGKKIAEHINVSSTPSIIKVNNPELQRIINDHLARFVPESDIQAGMIKFTEENIRDTASFISNLYEVFDRGDDIARTFYKSTKNGVNKVKELCKNEKHVPEILANLFFNAPGKDNRLDLEHVGLYLGDDGAENKKTLEHFTALHDFHNKKFLDSLRTYLQSFKLPGEGQKIDRIVEAFGKEYIKQNPHSEIGSSDNVYILAFATIMLSTDLHNANNSKKMTAEQFKKIFSGVENGQGFDSAFLGELYKSIKYGQLLCSFISEPPGYEIRTSALIKDDTYNKLSNYLYNHNSTAKDIFPNLQDADKWQITSQNPKSWLSKFMGYQGNIVLSNKENGSEQVIIQIYEPSILSRWFLSGKHSIIIQPTRGAIKAAATVAASIKPEVTSIKSTYNYQKEDLQAEYTNIKSTMVNAHSVPSHIRDIVMNNTEVIKPLYKSHFIEDAPMGNLDRKKHKIKKYCVNPKRHNSDRGIT